jgi:Streptomyces sporulation and cell division protein, SsgA
MAGHRVTRALTFHLIGPDDLGTPVHSRLCYDARHPYEVQAVFQGLRGEDVIWVFARELATVGLSAAAGEGDVRVWPSRIAHRKMVNIGLQSPDGNAVLRASARDVSAFLATTYALCPEGSECEHLDIEGCISDLLAT